MFNYLVDPSDGSELRLQTVRERDLEQQLKQSVERKQELQDELTKLKDDIRRQEKQLFGANQKATRLEQQLKQSAQREQQFYDKLEKVKDDVSDLQEWLQSTGSSSQCSHSQRYAGKKCTPVVRVTVISVLTEFTDHCFCTN